MICSASTTSCRARLSCYLDGSGKKALPISPLLTEREKRRVRRGKSWLISWEEFCSDDESDISISSSSNDNELDEFLFE